MTPSRIVVGFRCELRLASGPPRPTGRLPFVAVTGDVLAIARTSGSSRTTTPSPTTGDGCDRTLVARCFPTSGCLGGRWSDHWFATMRWLWLPRGFRPPVVVAVAHWCGGWFPTKLVIPRPPIDWLVRSGDATAERCLFWRGCGSAAERFLRSSLCRRSTVRR